MVLWVDDQPNNNRELLNQIKKKAKDKFEVHQLTSTEMTEKWMNNFNWILSLRNCKLKVISDMVRFEQKSFVEEENRVQNFYAGIDLLQRFSQEYGYTAPILIYCGSKKQGE